KIICDREREIEDFVPQEYWNIAADLTKEGLTPAQQKKNTFTATLTEYKGRKIKLENKEQTDKVLSDLNAGTYSVKKLESSETLKRPYAPYTTSTMQQDASIKLRFTPTKTMMLAQQLYQGVSVKGHGTTGLITYMRTDSVRISDEADKACKGYIKGTFGAGYVGNNRYTNKSVNAQDAHEAIRPSYMDLDPETVKDSLQSDQYKLYKLIWSRFVASRMKPAVYSVTTADIANGSYTLRAKGSTLKFDGYLKVYSDGKEEKDKALPPLEEGEILKLVKLEGEQKFTQPPARFTEASLIKEMEENGIGRPSTYATIVNTLTEKRYVAKEKSALSPTDLGNKITYVIMEPYFRELVDVGFTANMETQLDKVEEGDLQWQSVVGDYYNNYLKDELVKAREEVERVVTAPEFIGENCPECGKPLVRKNGKFGSFIACSGYPECRYTRNIIVGTGVACPKCGKEIIQKRSRKGKTFYGCSGYPGCDQVFWYKPVDKKCPKCGSLLLERGRKLVCSSEDCHYSENKK
ncbi:MAG: type I DNA topoisomerase, partial [Firmicutes bacterium]|nr:type I DNA topoisomerase [Bacillota bacterium]